MKMAAYAPMRKALHPSSPIPDALPYFQLVTLPGLGLKLPKRGHRMTVQIKADGNANLFGSLRMIAAMAVFAIEDALIKALSATLPMGQIMIIFGSFGAVLFALIARSKGQSLRNPDVLSKPMRIRVGFEITGRLFYFLALALIPLSAATVILHPSSSSRRTDIWSSRCSSPTKAVTLDIVCLVWCWTCTRVLSCATVVRIEFYCSVRVRREGSSWRLVYPALSSKAKLRLWYCQASHTHARRKSSCRCTV